MNQKNSEKGQAIVYLVLGLIVFFGFVALAIDGGMALANRRHEQNAADAASLAGGGKIAVDLENNAINTKNWACGDLMWAKNNGEVAARTRAGANGFPICDSHNSDAVCNATNYTNATCAGKYIDVTVDISATTPSNFLQIVFPHALSNNVLAVTRVYPRKPIAPGNAIIALNDGVCQGNQSGGIFYMNKQDASTLTVNNGSIFSNGCLKCNGQPNINVKCDLALDPKCDSTALGSFGNQPPETCNGTWTPPPSQTSSQIDPTLYSDINPDCTTYLTPVDFAKLYKKGPLARGLYCVSGSVSINAKDNLSGSNLTIVIKNGNLTINGGAIINLSASTDTRSSPEIPGVLFYLPGPDPFNPATCNKNNAWPTVSIEGTSGNIMLGSVVAPCSNVTLLGTQALDLTGQIVGWNVLVGGDASTSVTYNEHLVASSPTKIELHK